MYFGKHALTLSCLTSVLTPLPFTSAFPSYGSLAGLSERELASIIPTLKDTLPGKVPGPLKFNGTKLVNDAAHPWMPLRPGDIRGPCPGLNTLASHGVRLCLDSKAALDNEREYSTSPGMELRLPLRSSTPSKKVSHQHACDDLS